MFLSFAPLLVVNPAVSDTLFVFPITVNVENPKLRGTIKLPFCKLLKFESQGPDTNLNHTISVLQSGISVPFMGLKSPLTH